MYKGPGRVVMRTGCSIFKNNTAGDSLINFRGKPWLPKIE
jgi:hypothetical protein